MKLFLMTDMEGVCGVVNHDIWVTPEGRYYEEGKKLLTLEINAAVEGFYAAGATDILVVDAHGYGGINNLLLDERVKYLRGPLPTPYPYMLDASFDAIAWIGQHAKAGTEYAHMAHTGWFNTVDYRINDISVGEFGQVVAYRPAVSVLCADVPRPEGGDVIAFAGSTWIVLRMASSDDMAAQLWVEAA